ncbi:hexose kinase [Aerococcus sanguinicola]|uniref:hexose kinase n=1 Tax=unclassified Aerococcus TaxID=2618060 RepID=UPI0008A64F2A|nr:MULTISPECIES: hexose kinase [unclassified Aerococcus]KAB0647372.1 hexose kinase [Aerococcus sanguinicola]MDK6233164.1 hexose kinase [Aerococcus sp. UMB10185]MDK6856001.1 hexose kinase [Aerococcus sp. UMB7533]MDK8502404.1 hexose kinase [Aerococcus sp. UMB1112A]OFN00319.1 tagatose-6-phosphate kinase [Aerococcus sp. HMSC062A02]
MILTVTMNPSIDISYPIDHLEIDGVTRCQDVSKTAGGKGLNVARVIHQLGEDVLTTGILGGHHGAFIKDQLDRDGIKNAFSTCAGETRDSIAILHEGKQTEILESGPTISKEEEAAFLDQFQGLLDQVDTMTISGSMAKGLSPDLYTELIRRAAQAGVATLLDSSGQFLADAIASSDKPLLIKPNHHELGDLIGETLDPSDLDSLHQALLNPRFQGIEWIVVSLGGEGAFVKHQDKFYKANIPSIEVVNPVGSGDSTIAGLAIAISQHKSPEEVIKYGMTAGILNTMEKKTGHVNPDNFQTIYDQIEIKNYPNT